MGRPSAFAIKQKQPLLAFLLGAPLITFTRSHPGHGQNEQPWRLPVSRTPEQMQDALVTALSRAASCSAHKESDQIPILRTFSFGHKRRRINPPNPPQRRDFSTTAAEEQDVQIRHYGPDISIHSPELFMSLVDQYPSSYRQAYTALDLRNTPVIPAHVERFLQHRARKPAPHAKETADAQDTKDYIKERNILKLYLEDPKSHVDDIYAAYEKLPLDEIRQLPPEEIMELCMRLAFAVNSNREYSKRFFNLLEDLRVGGVKLDQKILNKALHLRGRSNAQVRDHNIEATLEMWKRFETDFGAGGDYVTYSTMFDLAIRSGKYQLVETMVREMADRDFRFGRYIRNAAIFYHGLRGDGDGVRAAYRQFVEQGEIVDTAVLNCVIKALLQAGEPGAADLVFRRMKNMIAETPISNPWPDEERHQRAHAQRLDQALITFKDSPAQLQRLRTKQPLTPNLRTYTIWITHHVSSTGELATIATLLEEMHRQNMAISGRIFCEIFRGFARHGGERYTMWTAERLETVFDVFLNNVENPISNVRFQDWTVIRIMQAYLKCTDVKTAHQIWRTVKSKWHVPSDRMAETERMIRGLFSEQKKPSLQDATVFW